MQLEDRIEDGEIAEIISYKCWKFDRKDNMK